MRVVSYDSVDKFWAVAGPLVAADPVRYTVLTGVTGRLLRGLPFGPDDPILLTLHEGDGAIGAALCTPPRPIQVNAVPESALPVLVDYLVDAGIRVSGALGVTDRVKAFADLWRAKVGDRVDVHMEQRLYRLGELVPPTDVPGAARLAGEADIALLTEWRARFVMEAFNTDRRPPDLDTVVAESVRPNGPNWLANMLWLVDDQPVSLAVAGRPDEHGVVRVAPVYTPPELRGHGYGSAATAAVSQWALDQGATHVVLNTDLANPVSNSIYQKIGYRPVLDEVQVTFGRLP